MSQEWFSLLTLLAGGLIGCGATIAANLFNHRQELKEKAQEKGLAQLEEIYCCVANANQQAYAFTMRTMDSLKKQEVLQTVSDDALSSTMGRLSLLVQFYHSELSTTLDKIDVKLGEFADHIYSMHGEGFGNHPEEKIDIDHRMNVCSRALFQLFLDLENEVTAKAKQMVANRTPP